MKKRIISMVVGCFFLILCTSTAYAKNVNETNEDHSQMESAQEIKANKLTALEFANGNSSNSYFVDALTNYGEDDWYRVYLTSGEQYLSLNGGHLNYYICDENGNEILSGEYDKTKYWYTGHRVDITREGYYYVRITGRGRSSYILSIGNPTYLNGQVKIPCVQRNISLSSGTRDLRFRGSIMNEIPDGAVAERIVFQGSGVASQTVKSARALNENRGISVDLRIYMWSADKLVSMNLPVKSDWTVTVKAGNGKTFTPELLIDYIYPVID